MNCYRYKLEHDYGFAPNPFHGTLSLATCKSQIRNNKNLHIGDWIIGLGSVAMGNVGRLIYAMKVENIITFDEYWNDSRFQCKKPVLNSSLVEMYGDNVYHTNPAGSVVQENCAHSLADGTPNNSHKDRDVRGKNVLLSKIFFYFGDKAPEIPHEFDFIKNVGRSLKYRDLIGEDDKINSFINWIKGNFAQGIHGDPCNWSKFKIGIQ